MTRSLAALACFTAALFGAASKSDAGPWMYDDSFYGPSWGGGYGWGGSYGGYTMGYAPYYSGHVASYGPAYTGNTCCGTTTGFSYGGACCAPCGTSCCNPCGTGCGPTCGTGCGTSCDPGCGNNCPGGNCPTGSGSAPVQSTPTDTGTGNNPTYAPGTNPPDNRTPPADQFGPARNNSPPRSRDGSGTGSTAPSPGGFNAPTTDGSTVDPNSSAPAPDFAPAQPQQPGYFDRKKDDQSRENGSVTPKVSPIQPGEKVAFKTPARFTRTNLQPVFELPTIVNAPPSTRPEAVPAPTAVASK